MEGVVTSTLLALVAGACIGLWYVASPVTMWCVVVTLGVIVWAGRDASPRERSWIWTLLGVAVGLRLLAVAALFISTDHDRVVSFFWDGDGAYMKQRSMWLRNVWLGVAIPADYYERTFELYGATDYLNVLAYMQYLVGPSPYGIHVFNVMVFTATCVLLYRLVLPTFGRETALVGLALMLFLPTPFAWSVSALKESVFVFMLALGAASAVGVLRGATWSQRLMALALLLLMLSTVEGLRTGGRLIVVAGLGVALALRLSLGRLWMAVLALSMIPAGVMVARRSAGVQERLSTQLTLAAERHLGNVWTEGNSYKLLDQDQYSDQTSMDAVRHMTPPQYARFVIRAVVAFIVVPLPSQARSRAELVFLPQQAIWYALVVFGVAGIVEGLRRDRLVTAVLLGIALVGGGTVAVSSGNIGTMVRHRDTIVPFLVWLSALGSVATVAHLMSKGRLGRTPHGAH